MQHHFEIEEAKKYGIEKAILIENLRFWILQNIANVKNQHDNHTWTYNSARAYSELFPYMSQHKIYRMLRELVEDGLLIDGNYNKVQYDRTKWYAFRNETSLYAILHRRKMEVTPALNGFNENEQPIPDRKPDVKPDKYTPEFLSFWEQYKRPVNKAGAFKMWNARLKEKIDPELIMTCLKNYNAQLNRDGTEQKFTMHATTFLNKDHRFEDYAEAEKPSPERQNFIDKNGNQYVNGEKTGHWDGTRFIPIVTRGIR